jgi:hypothetical protein
VIDEEAVQAVEFWTTDIAETKAIGTTSDPTAGLHFAGDEYRREGWTNPHNLGWSILVPRWRVVLNDEGEKARAEHPVYSLIIEEIERRKEHNKCLIPLLRP